MWAYAPLLMAAAFFLADAVVFFVAEGTAPYRTYAALKAGNGVQEKLDQVLTMNATSSGVRRLRWSLGTIAFLASFLLWVYFLPASYGLLASTMKRPICNTGMLSTHEYAYDFGYAPAFDGGWKDDTDAFVLEVQAVAILFLVWLVLPLFNSLNLRRGCSKLRTLRTKNADREKSSARIYQTGNVFQSTGPGFRRFQSLLLTILLVFLLGMVLAQALAAYQFGYSWAEGVARVESYSHVFDPKALGSAVIDQAICVIAIVITSGLVIGVTVCRWTIGGTNGVTFLVFMFWLLLAFLSYLPLILVFERLPVASKTDTQEQCKKTYNYKSEDYKTPFAICESRWWSYILGIISTLLVLAIMTLIGLRNGWKALFTRGVALTRKEGVWEEVAQDMRAAERKAEGTLRAMSGTMFELSNMQLVSLGGKRGYRSTASSFYNFDEERNALLAAEARQRAFTFKPMSRP